MLLYKFHARFIDEDGNLQEPEVGDVLLTADARSLIGRAESLPMMPDGLELVPTDGHQPCCGYYHWRIIEASA